MLHPVRSAPRLQTLVAGLLGLALCSGMSAADDPYEAYVKTSRDFKPVKQDKAMGYKAYPSWVYMPWYYQWTIGYDDAAGEFCQKTGYNGGFTDHGNPRNLAWFDKFKLRFYVDHLAGKGDLHLKNRNTMAATRPVMLDDALRSKLEEIISANIAKVKASPMRAAYALDDEISWGSFVKPCMWRITDDANYRAWLQEKYGTGKVPANPGWIGYNDVRPKLPGFTLGSFDASQLMDQWSFNDSWWNNFLGGLVEHANRIDPETPVGYVGGQSPNAFGGYDYAKLMRKVQYLEAYWGPDEQCMLQAFNPNHIPIVSTQFHQNTKDTIWQFFVGLAHGNRGHIGWVQNWFDGKTPKPFHQEISPALLEIGGKLGPLQAQAEAVKDGILLYYSHPSIQAGWIMDAQAHGGTWPNRNSDSRIGTYHLAKQAWVAMLRDSGFQPDFISYVDLLQQGIPKHAKVLVLSAVYCLSDAEAARIREFCRAGGTVVADFLPGVFDQHGKGRPGGGALDDLFGVKHDPGTKAADLYQGRADLWVEVDQDAHFSYKRYEEYLSQNACLQESGFNKAVRSMAVRKVNSFGSGKAVLMNLSPISYLAHRQAGFEAAKSREVFLKPIHDAGKRRWVEIEGAGAKEFGYEITYWKKNGRTIIFVVSNPEVSVNSEGGGNSVGLKSDEIEITLKFAKPLAGVKDERSGASLPAGSSFTTKWKMNEAVVLSFTSAD